MINFSVDINSLHQSILANKDYEENFSNEEKRFMKLMSEKQTDEFSVEELCYFLDNVYDLTETCYASKENLASKAINRLRNCKAQIVKNNQFWF